MSYRSLPALYSFHQPTMPKADSAQISISTWRRHVVRVRSTAKYSTAQATAIRPAITGNQAIKALARSAPEPVAPIVAINASGRQPQMVNVKADSAYDQP